MPMLLILTILLSMILFFLWKISGQLREIIARYDAGIRVTMQGPSDE